MGHVEVPAKLINPFKGVFLEVKALVDTGSTFTVISRSVAEKLRLEVTGRRRVRTASGFEDLDEAFLTVELEGERGGTTALISDKINLELIGVLTLEALALKVDPTTGRLEKTQLYLLVLNP